MSSPDSLIRKPALDTSRYSSATPGLTIAADLASLAVEITKSEVQIDPNRIWWYSSLPKNLSVTAADFPSSLAALELENLITNTPPDTQRLLLWISPAYNNQEARINIFFTHNDTGQAEFDAYGIPVRESPDQSEHRLTQFTPRSDTPNLPALVGMDAVTTPLSATISTQENIYHIAKTWITLPEEVWDRIESGEAKRVSQQLIIELIPVAQALQANITNNVDSHRSGAIAESGINQTTGRNLDFEGSDCGPSNSDFLTHSQVDSGHDQTRCPEIICPRCTWKPNQDQTSDVMSGKLKTCPCCNWPERPIPVPMSPVIEPTIETQTNFNPFTTAIPWSWLSDWWSNYSLKQAA